MDDDERGEPDQPKASRRTDQEIFDEQIARGSGKFIVQLGGLGILAAVVMSAIALVVSTHRSNTTVTVAAQPAAGQTTQLKGDALGQQLFVSGTPGGAVSCGSCHTMKAAGTSGTTGPNLDKVLTSDPPAPTRESIVNPNKDIVPGYRANVMPSNYETALTPQQLDAVVSYVYDSTNTKAKRSKTTP